MNSQSIERATSRNANNKHSTNGERNGLTKKLQLNLTASAEPRWSGVAAGEVSAFLWWRGRIAGRGGGGWWRLVLTSAAVVAVVLAAAGVAVEGDGVVNGGCCEEGGGRTPLNEHCSAVLLKKLPEKLGDPDKFLIPCDFPGMDECLALVDLGPSINLMPLSVWKKLSLPELTPTCMTLKLADRSISQPIELTLRVGKEVVTFNLDKTLRYSSNYDDMTANRIGGGVIEMACEEYSQEVLGFSDVIVSGNPTPYYDPIVSTSSPTLTPFGDSDFLFDEVDAFLALEDDVTSPEVDHSYYDPEGDILLLEAFLNDDPSLPPPTQGKLFGLNSKRT
ncbi:reverse transcriptase domain-containing protein [Tanacetum coccineum]